MLCRLSASYYGVAQTQAGWHYEARKWSRGTSGLDGVFGYFKPLPFKMSVLNKVAYSWTPSFSSYWGWGSPATSGLLGFRLLGLGATVASSGWRKLR